MSITAILAICFALYGMQWLSNPKNYRAADKRSKRIIY